MKAAFKSLFILVVASFFSHSAVSSSGRSDLILLRAKAKALGAMSCRAAVSRIEVPPFMENMHDIFMHQFAMKKSWTGPHDVMERWTVASPDEKKQFTEFAKSYETHRLAYQASPSALPKTMKRVVDIVFTYEGVVKNWSDDKLERARSNPKAFFEELYAHNTRQANISNKIQVSELMDFFRQVQSLMKNADAILEKLNAEPKREYQPEDVISVEDVAKNALRSFLSVNRRIPENAVIRFHGSTINGRGIKNISDIDHAFALPEHSEHSDAIANVIFQTAEFRSAMEKLGVKEVETHHPDSGAMSPLQVDVSLDSIRLYLFMPIFENGIEKAERLFIGEL